ncbi:hypothetical protein Taro_043232 [Colocasia esculenta]|uniref:Uncharacterized protein n=1 Tax=Colocasia esculenta TaxID=4460 RepID=A0A843WKI7_COLES|nr:hypothetical protein [Colocasia esculenta]
MVFTLFRCFVVPCSRVVLLPLLLEFLLLWLVRDWLSLLSLVREAHPPTLFRSSLLDGRGGDLFAVHCQQCEM